MPTDIRIIHARDFVRATVDGRLDREESMKALTGIVAAGEESTARHVLLDTRKAQLVLSVADLWFLAKGLATFRRTLEQATAVLCPSEELELAEFFALCAQNRGL